MTEILAVSLYCCCCTTLWNAEVLVWLFTTMNLYWVAHVSAQKWLT